MKIKLFVDTNIFLYFLTKDETKWMQIGDIFDNDNYELFTSVIVINELKFKLLWLNAAQKLDTNKKFMIINQIKKDNQLRSDVYSKFLEAYINFKDKIAILDLSDKYEQLSCSISADFGLLPSDASIAATMLKNNIKKILTDDTDFKKVDLIEVVDI